MLLVSPNNSAPAIESLVNKTHASVLIHGSKYVGVASAAKQLLSSSGVALEIVPLYEVIANDHESNEGAFESPACSITPEEERSSDFIILHSSGSTSFPKPITFKQSCIVEGIGASWMARNILTTLPFCHAYGNSVMWSTLVQGKSLYVIPPAVPMTLDNLLQGLEQSKADSFCAVPYTLKLLASTKESRDFLARTTQSVFNGGSSCAADVGNALEAAGVHLLDFYGATECAGFMLSGKVFSPGISWRTQVINPAARDFVTMEHFEQDLYEPVIKEGWSRKRLSNRPDGSYAMGDLFKRDPDCEEGWIYVGRTDDTLVHITGEKTNPVPMETQIRTSLWVRDALVVGAERPQTAALIIMSEEAEKYDLQTALELIWPAVQEANKAAPSHSRLVPELIRLLPATSSFINTDKMSIMRRKTVAAFKDIIDDIYDLYLRGVQESKVVLQDDLHAQQVVRKIVSECIESDKLADTTDLFDFGVDSITAERISAALTRTVHLDSHEVSPSFIFENPTIAAMATALLRGTAKTVDPLQSMKDLVLKHIKRVKVQDHHGSFMHEARAHTVVLTGATGSLGAHLLHELVQNPQIAEVVCLCRARDDVDARKRIEQSLATRGLPPLDSLPAQVKVHTLSADLTKPTLGLNPPTFSRLQRETTAVIHCGWPVNFNMSLGSFESSIEGSVHLMNLCVDSCGAFLFCSSVSTMGHYKDREIPEEVCTDPAAAMDMGYAQSKWVMENLCLEARTKGVESSILRIGQMVFDTKKGIWNDKEAIPLMISGIEAIHAMPDQSSQRVNWLPVDKAAQMIVALLHQRVRPRTAAGVYHITSKVDLPWKTVYDGLRSAGLEFDLVPPHEWLAKLQSFAQANAPKDSATRGSSKAKATPVLKLLEHFSRQFKDQSAVDSDLVFKSDARPRVFVQGQVEDKSRSSVSLDYVFTDGLTEDWYHTDPIREEDIVKMVAAWRESGFLSK